MLVTDTSSDSALYDKFGDLPKFEFVINETQLIENERQTKNCRKRYNDMKRIQWRDINDLILEGLQHFNTDLNMYEMSKNIRHLLDIENIVNIYEASNVYCSSWYLAFIAFGLKVCLI